MMSDAYHDEVHAAHALLAEKSFPPWQTVAAVVLTESGQRQLALNIDSRLPRAGVCAEPIAVGMAVAQDPQDPVVFVAAVNLTGRVIAPCGPCRELLTDYGPDAQVAVPVSDGFETIPLRDLHPFVHRREERRQV